MRAAVGVVEQDPFLFHATVADNIRYARPDASDAEVADAVEAAGLGDLVARHEPNPCDKHDSVLYVTPPLEAYAWYYQSFVENRGTVPMHVVWFDHFLLHEGTWYPGNVKERPLTGLDFGQWYGDDGPLLRGRIDPGRAARCKVNWHLWGEPVAGPRKWAYRAVDQNGGAHYAEAVLESVPYLE